MFTDQSSFSSQKSGFLGRDDKMTELNASSESKRDSSFGNMSLMSADRRGMSEFRTLKLKKKEEDEDMSMDSILLPKSSSKPRRPPKETPRGNEKGKLKSLQDWERENNIDTSWIDDIKKKKSEKTNTITSNWLAYGSGVSNMDITTSAPRGEWSKSLKADRSNFHVDTDKRVEPSVVESVQFESNGMYSDFSPVEPIIDRHYLSQKISVARWKPEGMDSDSDMFLTGSWDNSENTISLWSLKTTSVSHGELVPVLQASVSVNGDVSEIRFINDSTLVYSTSEGKVAILTMNSKLSKNTFDFNEQISWPNLHKLKHGAPASSNCLSINDGNIISGGSDGKVFLLNAEIPDPIGILGSEKCVAVQAVSFIKHNEVVSGNLMGQIKLFDVRANMDAPVKHFNYNDKALVSITCMEAFPTQKHMLFVSGENGSVTVWDLRKDDAPLILYNAHGKSVENLHFHHNRPGNMFTCSSDGEIWQWFDMDKKICLNRSTEPVYYYGNIPVVQSDEKTSSVPKLRELMGHCGYPTNNVDANRYKIIASSDLESVLIISSLSLV